MDKISKKLFKCLERISEYQKNIEIVNEDVQFGHSEFHNILVDTNFYYDDKKI